MEVQNLVPLIEHPAGLFGGGVTSFFFKFFDSIPGSLSGWNGTPLPQLRHPGPGGLDKKNTINANKKHPREIGIRILSHNCVMSHTRSHV